MLETVLGLTPVEAAICRWLRFSDRHQPKQVIAMRRFVRSRWPGALHTAWAFVHEHASPTSRARVLGEGISETMHSLLFMVLGALVLGVSSVLARRARRPKP